MLRCLLSLTPFFLCIDLVGADDRALKEANSVDADEVVTIVGHLAELFVKEGEVLTSECKTGEKTWWFCNILVKIPESTDSSEQWQQGIWMCTYGLWPEFHKNGLGWFKPSKIRYQCVVGQKAI